MTELLFDFEDMAAEVDAFARLAEPFISNESHYVLPALRGSLQTYRDQLTEKPADWVIPIDKPLRTIVSYGGYEIGGGGGLSIFAEITAKWQIKRVAPKKKCLRAKHFRLVGIASTKVRLLSLGTNENPSCEIAMWRMEVGDGASPGCHFHVQILGESEDYPFPKSVPVPRLPGLLLTPAAVIEFVIAELFQDEWLMHIAQDSANLQRWASIQRPRFEKLFKWHLAALEGVGSPWSNLKKKQPSDDLFLAVK